MVFLLGDFFCSKDPDDAAVADDAAADDDAGAIGRGNAAADSFSDVSLDCCLFLAPAVVDNVLLFVFVVDEEPNGDGGLFRCLRDKTESGTTTSSFAVQADAVCFGTARVPSAIVTLE